jgi:hypothetical protein
LSALLKSGPVRRGDRHDIEKSQHIATTIIATTIIATTIIATTIIATTVMTTTVIATTIVAAPATPLHSMM